MQVVSCNALRHNFYDVVKRGKTLLDHQTGFLGWKEDNHCF